MNPIEALERVATFEGYTWTQNFSKSVNQKFAQTKIKFFYKKLKKHFDILFLEMGLRSNRYLLIPGCIKNTMAKFRYLTPNICM